MGQASRRKTRRPSWFTPRFDQYSEWATLRVPEDKAAEWLRGAAMVLETPLWNELVALQSVLTRLIQERDWKNVTAWELIARLQRIGDIEEGIDRFLPAPYNEWPLDYRRVLYPDRVPDRGRRDDRRQSAGGFRYSRSGPSAAARARSAPGRQAALVSTGAARRPQHRGVLEKSTSRCCGCRASESALSGGGARSTYLVAPTE